MFFRFHFFFLLLLSYTSFAQGDSLVVSPEFLAKQNPITLSQFRDTIISDYIHYFPMKFAQFQFDEDDIALLDRLSDTIVERIELVYTLLKGKNFDQVKLNRERYEMLRSYFPAAFKSNLIEWKLIVQDGSLEYDIAKNYFHGFVIYIKPYRVTTSDGTIITTVMDRRIDDVDSKILTTNEEIEKVKKLVGYADKKVKMTLVKEKVEKWETIKQWTGKYVHHIPEKRKEGKLFDKAGPMNRPKQYVTKRVKKVSYIEKEIPTKDSISYIESAKASVARVSADSVILTHFPKNEERWKNYVIAQDLTASMYPYIAQTLMYFKNKATESPKKIIFFNDGDKSPDGLIGRTGGLYYVNSNLYSEIEKKAFDCMLGGNGGKKAENDLEAVLYAAKKAPEAKGILLIADNYSKIRDIPLITEVTALSKPVDIILCGVEKSGDINLDYIYLARRTGGNIYTIEKTYNNLNQYKNGDLFKVGSQVFKIEANKINLVEMPR